LNSPKSHINDLKARLIGIPTISLSINIAYHWNDKIFFSSDTLWGLLIAFLNTFFIWEGLRKIMHILIIKYPNFEQTKQRLIIQTIASLFYTFLITFSLDLLCRVISPHSAKPNIWIGFAIGLVPTIIVTLIYESVFFFQSWKAGIQKAEALARANVQSQLESLKSQLDPHFLFNSLNTLSFLIDETNQEAQKYLEKLADVYRYVLISKQKDVVTLQEEMDFVDAYMYLNKVRFRENIQLEKHIAPEILQKKIAPLSLQMLIENAIKHNIISKDKPLTIDIFADDHTLAVQNNLQEKKTFYKSTKVGLENIKNRYALLSKKDIFIEKNQDFFRVEIPLL
jgi:hypothetical protein